MSGYGMGTTMVNYYRKKGEQDEHIPKVSVLGLLQGRCLTFCSSTLVSPRS